MQKFKQNVCNLLKSERGEAYVGEAVKIVIAIVLGAALLAGLVAIFNKVVLPKTEKWITDLFTHADGYVTSINGSNYTPTVS